MWCFDGYYTQGSPLFYTFFSPRSDSKNNTCELTYSYSYTGGSGGCFLGARTIREILDRNTSSVIQFSYTSIEEEDEKIQRRYVNIGCN